MWLILHFTQNGGTLTWLGVQSPTYMPAWLTEPRGLLPPQTRVQVPLVPPGLTKAVSEQSGATWKQHTNQTIIHNSIIPKQCSETSFQPNHFTSLLCSLFHFLYTLPGVIGQPMPSGRAQRNSQRLGEFQSLTLPH